MSSLNARRNELQQAIGSSSKSGWTILDSTPNGEIHAERPVGAYLLKVAGHPSGMWEAVYTRNSAYCTVADATEAIAAADRWA